MIRRGKSSRSRRKKQPRRRYYATAATAGTRMPGTARRRRRQNSRLYGLLRSSLPRVLFTSRWLSLALLAAALAAMVHIGLSEDHHLTLIPVEGAETYTPTEIVEASGLAGAHIFTVDPSEAAAAIRELPAISAATVTLRWPNHVHIEVVEETPIAVWEESGVAYWISESGGLMAARGDDPHLLRIVSEMPIPAVPVRPEAEADASDEASEEEEERLPAAIEFVPRDVLVGALQLRELRPNIDRLYYRPAGGLSYQDGRGWRAYFGRGQDMDQRLAIYEAIVDKLLAGGLQPEYISVSNKERPFYLAS